LTTRVRVGICAWADPALIESGTFYPKKSMSAEARLRHYASVFDVVEVNSSYYAIPDVRNTVRWVERTPPEFVFHVKAYSLMTGHHPRAETLPADVVARNALRAHLYLLDTHADGLHGGTGTPFDWAALQGVGPRCLVAGGLRPDNVAVALATLAPLGVDVSSGVEFPQTPQFDRTTHDSPLTTPTNGGGKDPRLIQAFLEAVRSYDKRAE